MKSLFTRGICVVGRGRWASSLLAALDAQGLTTMSASFRKDVKRARKGALGESAWLRAEVFWLCVPDAEIEAVARRLLQALGGAHDSMRGRVVLHSSGVYSSRILTAVRDAGAGVGSVHPMMSFPKRKPVPLTGVPFAVETRGPLKTKLFRLVRALGGEPFAIPAESKVLYHAAAVMASPLLLSIVAAAVETAEFAGLSGKKAKALLQPIMEASLKNFFRDGASKSFSGPFARGDARTVSLHLEALAEHPQLQQVYRSLALHALESFPVRESENLRRSLGADAPGIAKR